VGANRLRPCYGEILGSGWGALLGLEVLVVWYFAKGSVDEWMNGRKGGKAEEKVD
jgi:hypothetical protein